ncbi:hypothetical protein [Leifsonia xyli]|uniref:hypothetical protein n=1 Tax=Leifsonia xyli TaxID=1575 RepID=UPI0012DE6AA2|nr:hypothetical protein [Leifsonia xyli]
MGTWIAVAAYTQLVNIYSAACGLLIVRQGRYLLSDSSQPGLRRAGTAVLMAGFALAFVGHRAVRKTEDESLSFANNSFLIMDNSGCFGQYWLNTSGLTPVHAHRNR